MTKMQLRSCKSTVNHSSVVIRTVTAKQLIWVQSLVKSLNILNFFCWIRIIRIKKKHDHETAVDATYSYAFLVKFYSFGICIFASVRKYRSGTVNSKSFVGKVLLRIKRKFELTVHFKHEMIRKTYSQKLHRKFELSGSSN